MSASCYLVKRALLAVERAPGILRDFLLPKQSGFLTGYEPDTKAQCEIGPDPVRHDGNPVSHA
jgi:hypothetical protein